MKKKMFAAICAAACLCGCAKETTGQNDNGITSQTNGNSPEQEDDDVCVHMTDPYFRAYCIENFDSDGNGKVSKAEAEAATKMYDCDIPEDLTGIEYFPNLELLAAHSVRVLDLSGNLKLVSLDLSSSPVENVDLSRNTAMSVTGIGVFYECSSLKSVTLPESVTVISSNSFFCCGSLASLTLPEGLVSVNDGAFQRSGLTAICLPENVYNISTQAFDECGSLVSVTSAATTPPALKDKAFGVPSDAVLHVPAESLELYKSSAWAAYFSSIVAME